MISRRSLLALASLPAVLKSAGRGTMLPAALERYNDLATDLPVTRLTDFKVTSILPPASANTVARRGFLLYSSDASGRFEAYRMDLKKGESRQVTDAAAMAPASLVLLPNENSFLFVDGPRVMLSTFSALQPTQVYKLPDGFECGDLHVSSDGLFLALIERRGSLHRLRLVNTRTFAATTLAEAEEELAQPVTRPKRASVLYRRGQALYLANFDGKQNYRLRTAGGVVQASWSPDGRSALYLQAPRTLREFTPDTNEDHNITETTQFASFAPNRDASIFVGAGGSKVAPYVLLLARAVKRELTLCEHRASDPAMVRPQFSPNSQQVFFSSDLHGKPAIYRMDVEKLVAETAP